MKKLLFAMLVLLASASLYSQHESHYIKGKVFEKDKNGEKQILPYASVYWLNTGSGVISDSTGAFSIHKPHDEENLRIIVSHLGYLSDTIPVSLHQENLDVVLEKSLSLEEVTITKNQGTQIKSRINLIPTQIITEAGLQKLACCNIGESFESNATIDVGFSDAVSGAKKIRMLGLDGKYSQFLFENIPFMRGPESGYGLSHIPGPFMESIQVSKGTSSVLNGYESTTGQINVEYKKPEESDLIFLNLFANTEGRYEGNFTSAIGISEKLQTGIFLHASTQSRKVDQNSDNFYDIPVMEQINFLNRWEYHAGENLHMQFGVEVLDEERTSGEIDFLRDNSDSELYSINVDISKFRAFGKIGFAFKNKPYQSLGWINSFTRFEQSSYFGRRSYEGNVSSYYSNLIFQTIIDNTSHKISSGLSFQYDDYSEFYLQDDFSRREIVSGIFTQYTWDIPEKSVLMGGWRADYNSLHGLLLTPRLHWKYNVNKNLIIRSTLGKAWRSANVMTENIGLLATSRELYFDQDFSIEEAWNYGMNFTRHFHMAGQRKGYFSVDFYRTDFQNQIVTDLDFSTREAHFFNLQGKSWSNSFQAELNGEFVRGLDLTLAYRFNDVKVDYLNQRMEMPFVYRHKGLFTTTYSTPFDKWSIDLTVQYNGKSRIPETKMNPDEFQRASYSPGFFKVHSQLTRRFKHLDVYLGVENLTDFMQENPIISSGNPFGEYFDASMVWGPLTGRMFYAGLRFSIQ